MTEPEIKFRYRYLPHWTLEGSTDFITFRVRQGRELSCDDRSIVLQHLRAGDGRFYLLAAAVIMPDHAHLLLKPQSGYDLSRIMKGIKGVSAHLITRARKTCGNVWQDESWDRIMRDRDEFLEKLNYMADNPIKAGLVRELEEYDAWYCAAARL